MRFVLIWVVGTFLVVSMAWASEPVPRPAVKVGDRWAFRTTDLWKNQETGRFEYVVTGVNGDNVELVKTVTGAMNQSSVGRRSKSKADLSTWTFENATIVEGRYVTFAFPIDVGNSWTYAYSRRAADDLINQERTATVEGWEDVSVPAGKFRALKVVHSGHYTRKTPTESFSGRVTETFWYVPEVKRFVRREYRDTTGSGRTWDHMVEELTDFSAN